MTPKRLVIGECKSCWGKELHGRDRAIVGCTVSRDMKASLILFTRRQEASATIEKADAAIRVHRCFKRDGQPTLDGYAGCNCILCQTDDENR